MGKAVASILVLGIILASDSIFSQVPKPNEFVCKLQWVHENEFEQINWGEPPAYICKYSCQDTDSVFYWQEVNDITQGCKITKILIKT